MQLKLVFIISLFVFWFFTVAISIVFVIFSAQTVDEESSTKMLEMTEKDATDFVKTWYLAVFLWGYVIFNGLRVYLVSLLAPNQAKYEFEKEHEEGENIDGCGGWGRCSCS